jgi:hypothetical protein
MWKFKAFKNFGDQNKTKNQTTNKTKINKQEQNKKTRKNKLTTCS